MNQIKQMLQLYIDLNEMGFEDMAGVSDNQLATVCSGIDITLVRNVWSALHDEKIAEYTNNNVDIFISNTMAANKDLMDMFPGWAYQADIKKGTLMIYWNGLPAQDGVK